MYQPEATTEQKTGAALIRELITKSEITREEFRSRGYECAVKNMVNGENIFRLHDSRKIEGSYRQANGDIVVIYISWGSPRYYAISEQEFQSARFVDVPTPRNIYFEF